MIISTTAIMRCLSSPIGGGIQCFSRSSTTKRSVSTLRIYDVLSKNLLHDDSSKIIQRNVIESRRGNIMERQHNYRTWQQRITTSSFSTTTTTSLTSDDEREIVLKHHHNSEMNATISTLLLNRPNAANAMGKVMIQQLQECLDELSVVDNSSNSSRCLIIKSTHPKGILSAGADLKERRSMSQNEASDFVTQLRSAMHQISTLPIPVICVIEGSALGGGLELALACDIRIASNTPSIKLGLPETSLAIIPGAGGTQRLSRLIGISRAKELIFTAKTIDVQTAYNYGLVQYIIDDDDNNNDNNDPSTKEESSSAYMFAMDMGWRIASNGPLAISASKKAIDDGYYNSDNIEQALEIEKKHYQTIIPTSDRLEGLQAFREKRKPIYKGE